MPAHLIPGPVAVTAGATLFTLVGLGMMIGAVQSFGAWRLSGYVQSQGTLVPGTVMRVHDIEHPGRYGDWYTAEVTVRLQRPVDGATTTTVNDPTAAAVVTGEPVTVRVDPRQPGYAEFPGKPYGDAGTWIAVAILPQEPRHARTAILGSRSAPRQGPASGPVSQRGSAASRSGRRRP